MGRPFLAAFKIAGSSEGGRESMVEGFVKPVGCKPEVKE